MNPNAGFSQRARFLPRQWQRQHWNRFVNVLVFNALWPVCVIGAAKGLVWPGVLLSLALLAWHLVPLHRVRGDGVLVLLCLSVGTLLDTLWIRLAWLDFASPGPYPLWAPLWIVALWLGFALALNHSLQWLQRWPITAATSFIFFAPFSYFMASRLGAVSWTGDFLITALVIGISWSVLMAFLLTLARRMRTSGEQ
ncbi:MAG: DUF2878 domain-containing protein [Xanthomonadales bacterium]|nr:DUF2878 domain-containing protein [Xanthomonadales bacterium]